MSTLQVYLQIPILRIHDTFFTNFYHSGISSSQSSMMKTRRIYNLMLLRFFCLKPIGRKPQRAELNLTLNAELLHGQMVDMHNDINNFARHRVKRAAESGDRMFRSTDSLSGKIFVAKQKIILRNSATSSNMNSITAPRFLISTA